MEKTKQPSNISKWLFLVSGIALIVFAYYGKVILLKNHVMISDVLLAGLSRFSLVGGTFIFLYGFMMFFNEKNSSQIIDKRENADNNEKHVNVRSNYSLSDSENLYNDFVAIGNDMRKVMGLPLWPHYTQKVGPKVKRRTDGSKKKKGWK